MGFKATNWVLDYSEATLGRRLVLIALSDYAHDDGSKAFPSIETLTKKARLSRRGVQDALRRLEADGEIVRSGQTRNGTIVYTITGLAALAEEEGRRNCSQGVQNLPAGGAESARASGAESAPDPSNRHITRQGKNGSQPEPVGFEEWLTAHCELTGQRTPGVSTRARRELARKFGEMMGEGHTLDELKLASVGAHADEWRRENGKDYPRNVLVFDKVDELIDKGRKVKPRTARRFVRRPGLPPTGERDV